PGLFALPGVLWALVTGYALLPSAEELHALGRAAIWPYLPYALVGILPAAVLTIRGLRALDARARMTVLLLLMCILVSPFLAALAFPRVSLNPRYFTAGVPLMLIVLGAGMPRARVALWHVGAGALLVALMVLSDVLELSHPGQKREDIVAAGAWLDHNVPLDEEILVTSDEMTSLALYHWPKRRIRLYPDRKVVASDSNAGALADMVKLTPP